MTKQLIEPRILKGFQDTHPKAALQRRDMIARLERVFRLFGFAPIETPALEYAEILLGKGSEETDKQTYRFTDNGGRDIALRFDLTVPLARFAAQYQNELTFPFKRYHIAPVWRAEKPQRGRYREFYQCDFDIIGTDSQVADAEILAVVHEALDSIGIDHLIRVNNRKILNGLLDSLSAKEKSTSVLRAIDKLEKMGQELVQRELRDEAGLNDQQIGQVFKYMELSAKKLSAEDLLGNLKEFLHGSELGLKGISELTAVLQNAEAYGVKAPHITIDLSIARGLDYYTGTVLETTLIDFPTIGSICSGGRYDDLASLYTKRRLPGVGTSIGLDRIIGALEELKKLPDESSPTKVFITVLDEVAKRKAIELAAVLHKAGIAAEVALEVSALGNQLKYADKKGVPIAVILGSKELESGVCPVKNLRTKVQKDGVSFGDLVSVASEMLAG